jgi:hypothetical protein
VMSVEKNRKSSVVQVLVVGSRRATGDYDGVPHIPCGKSPTNG